MTITYVDAVKQARLQVVIDAVDAGSAPGKLKIRDSSNVVLATFTLADPSGSASGGTLTWDFSPAISDSSADATGTADNAIMTDSDDNLVVSGLTVGVGSGNVQLTSLSITAGQTVTITAGSFTHG